MRTSALVLAAGCIAGLACSSTDGPGSVLGTYELVGYLDGSSVRTLPYVQQASTSPSDTEEWIGGSLTLAADSTIVTIWDYVFCPKGVCGAVQPDTGRGTFSHFPPGDSAGRIMFLVSSPYSAGTVPAAVQGRQLTYANFWVFRR